MLEKLCEKGDTIDENMEKHNHFGNQWRSF